MSTPKTYDREGCSSGFQPGDEWEGNDGGKMQLEGNGPK
jgi:hypothetical protein